jgi:hypothetical protein
MWTASGAAPQMNCLLTQEGKTAVDWIGRGEQLSSDLSDLVAILNARPGVPSLPTVQTSKANYHASPCAVLTTASCVGTWGTVRLLTSLQQWQADIRWPRLLQPSPFVVRCITKRAWHGGSGGGSRARHISSFAC